MLVWYLDISPINMPCIYLYGWSFMRRRRRACCTTSRRHFSGMILRMNIVLIIIIKAWKIMLSFRRPPPSLILYWWNQQLQLVYTGPSINGAGLILSEHNLGHRYNYDKSLTKSQWPRLVQQARHNVFQHHFKWVTFG